MLFIIVDRLEINIRIVYIVIPIKKEKDISLLFYLQELSILYWV